MLREAAYQHKLIKKIRAAFPGCVIMKNDPNYLQGMPDLTVLYSDRWAALEVKNRANAPHQPNQDYYIQKLSKMSYASFVYPENEEEVFCELQQTFRPDREARHPEREQVPLGELRHRQAPGRVPEHAGRTVRNRNARSRVQADPKSCTAAKEQADAEPLCQ